MIRKGEVEAPNSGPRLSSRSETPKPRALLSRTREDPQKARRRQVPPRARAAQPPPWRRSGRGSDESQFLINPVASCSPTTRQRRNSEVLGLSQAPSPGRPRCHLPPPRPGLENQAHAPAPVSASPASPQGLSLSPKGRHFLEAGKSQGGRDLAPLPASGGKGRRRVGTCGRGWGCLAFLSPSPRCSQPRSSVPSSSFSDVCAGARAWGWGWEVGGVCDRVGPPSPRGCGWVEERKRHASGVSMG